ncbi:hypothetical protein RISK_004039 [Rhodopirellula islandica]|uniref:Uncharacterized protein n=1 Tax=Rhodopirellula islandica TaxID=595434 RepID=A0A0J1BA97_RHOIS|nr:hypothetical protein RISK_004039 [Rhodopirellula islandica]
MSSNLPPQQVAHPSFCNPSGLGFQPENPPSQPAAQATREQQVTMLAVCRKPPGEEPEGSRPSALREQTRRETR